jgi:hypothetical protein
MNIRSTSIFKDLSPLHGKYVIFSTDKAHTNNVFVCKSHYIDYLMKESRYWQFTCQPHIYPTTLTKEEILDNQVCCLSLWNFNQR